MKCLEEIEYCDIVPCSSVCGRKAAHLGFGFDRDRPGLHGGFITSFQEVYFAERCVSLSE